MYPAMKHGRRCYAKLLGGASLLRAGYTESEKMNIMGTCPPDQEVDLCLGRVCVTAWASVWALWDENP